MKKRHFINLIVFVLVLTFAALNYYLRESTITKSRFLMETLVEITATSTNKHQEQIIEKTFDLMENYDAKFSFYRKGGKLWKINHNFADTFFIDNDFYQMLSLGKKLYGDTDSLYDLTIGRLSEIWDFDKNRIPTADSIKTALQNIGFDKIVFSENELFKPKNIEINLGSLAKGFIVDKAVEFLQKNGIKKGIVNAGGDLRIFGYKKPLEIGIQHPRKKRNEIIAILKVKNKAVVTSGDYEQFFIIDGKRYHHILNPKTGFPARTCVSVTVIASTALQADAFSTALFLLKPKSAIELANKTPNLEAIIYATENGSLVSYKSKNINQYLAVEYEK